MSTSSVSEANGKSRPTEELGGGKEGEGGGSSSEGGKVKEERTAAVPPPTGGFFAWVVPALKKRRMLKTWVRCVLALAGAMVLLVDHATLNTMGQAGFFAAIVSVMLPPSLALSVFVLASITLLLGMLLGWAWGAACMAAALSVQDKALLAARQVAAQKSLVAGISPTVQIQSLVFHGYFLDTRSSAVYGAMFFIGTFAMGALRAKAPRLALLGIFGTIVMDVFCSTGPLLPTAQYTIAKMFLIPTCYYLAIAIASLVLIFPESLNHIWLTMLDQAFFGPTLSILSLQATALAARPSDHAGWAGIAGKVAAARAGLGGGLAGLAAQIGLIDLEISVGRLGPGDLKRLAPELRALGFRTSGLMAFQTAVTTANTDAAVVSPAAAADEPDPRAHSRFARKRKLIVEREARHGHDLDTMVPILGAASAPLRTASEAALVALRAWFVGCNSGRWTGLVRRKDEKVVKERQQGLVEVRDKLGAALAEFRAVERVKLIKPYERFFDPETGRLLASIGRAAEDPEMFSVRSLFICFVFCDTLDAFAARVHRILGLVVELDVKRPSPRLWMPSGFGMIGRKLMSRSEVTAGDTQPLAMGTASDPTNFDPQGSMDNVDDDVPDDEDEVPARPRNPDALPPTSGLGRFFVGLGAALRFFKTPEAYRAAGTPLVPRTAWFFYGNKGLWRSSWHRQPRNIAGDQLFGLATRLLGTLAGLLVGMSCGTSPRPGRPTGTRHVLDDDRCDDGVRRGYSWLDTHFPLLANTGVGIAVGLLVIIGFTAGELGSIFGQEVEAFLAEEARARGGHYEKEKIDLVGVGNSEETLSPKERRVRKVGRRVLVVFERLQGLAPSLMTGRWEPQVQGLWPHEQYQLLHAKETKLITSLALLNGAFSKLDTKWCSILVHRTPFLNPNLLSDIFSTIDILSHALEAGHPVPASLPCLRDRLIYHDAHIRAMSGGEPVRTTVALPVDKDDSDSESGASEFVAGKVDGASIGFEELSLSVLMDEQLPTHSTGTLHYLFHFLLYPRSNDVAFTAVIALASILTLIDEIGVIVRELCGETTFRGFDALHHEFLGREEAAIGTFPRKT
ncbi:hypothetical protein B0H17DRAFT_1077726 [Mycena rosella]|uniref:ER transporter 6TM N-terminal domain-containing protein n=1 Tax=Mycena rosella TaxID=1033263 RepID=A0AAD7GBL2_MYCRO|nr:hypothetical protein B0H17DRAFT_1077726 [Mycena rosella]